MKQSNNQIVINVDLMNEILAQENKIMKLNKCLNEIKLSEKKLKSYKETIQKELNLIFRFCLGLVAGIIVIIGLMLIAYAQIDNENMKNIYTICNGLVLPLLIVSGINIFMFIIFHHCEKPLEKSTKYMLKEVTTISKNIVNEIANLSILKQKQLQQVEALKMKNQNNLPKYELSLFLKELETSPKYEMFKILDTLERKNIELPRKNESEIQERAK